MTFKTPPFQSPSSSSVSPAALPPPVPLKKARPWHSKVSLKFSCCSSNRNAISKMLLPSPNTIRQLSFICAIRPVSASVKAPLPNSHTVMNDRPLAFKVVFWQMLQRLPRRGFHFFSHFFFCNFFYHRLFLKPKIFSPLLLFFRF